jgi:hypothetical protein
MNDCDYREFDEFWKADLQRHDHDVHEKQNVLLLFSSINYIIWCHEMWLLIILKIAKVVY